MLSITKMATKDVLSLALPQRNKEQLLKNKTHGESPERGGEAEAPAPQRPRPIALEGQEKRLNLTTLLHPQPTQHCVEKEKRTQEDNQHPLHPLQNCGLL